MFAQAISSTQSAAPLTASSSRRDCCDSSSRNEFTRMPVCAFSFGYCWRSCEAISRHLGVCAGDRHAGLEPADHFEKVVVAILERLRREVAPAATSPRRAWGS